MDESEKEAGLKNKSKVLMSKKENGGNYRLGTGLN